MQLQLLLGLLILGLPLALLVRSAAAPVSRARVARFAWRQQLEITPDNGNQVIAYLAVTRRWRVAGLVAALLLAGMVVSVTGEGEVSVLQLLAGWFVGAVVAEARLARRPSGPRRTASLHRRDPAGYLSRAARVVPLVAVGVSLSLGGLALLAAASGRELDRRAAVLGLAAALMVTGVVWAVRRRVLARPQPALPPDQRAADDAVRSRSLHVLAGAGAALVLYAVTYQLYALVGAWPAVDGELQLAAVALLLLGAPLTGWLVATMAWPVRRPAPV